MKLLRRLACEVGRGVLSGLAGTAAMTVSSTLEMKLRGRPPSTTPAKAAERVLGIEARDQSGEARLGQVVHWQYGTGWGLLRALLGTVGVEGHLAAPALHFAAVWGASLMALPVIGVAPPVAQWSPEEIAIDVLHHLVYVTAADAAYRATA
jgi:hypothetical protein